MQMRTARRVLQYHRFSAQGFGGREGRQGGFVEAAQDELALAGVGDDVAHGVDAGHAGGKGGGVHHQLFALHGQAPIGNRAQAG